MILKPIFFDDPKSLKYEKYLLSYWDHQQVCRFANHEFASWFGKHPSELVGKMTFQMLTGSMYQTFAPFMVNALKGTYQLQNLKLINVAGGRSHAIGSYYPDFFGNKVSGVFLQIGFADPENVVNSSYQPGQHTLSNASVKIAAFLNTQLFNEFPGMEELAKMHFISVSKLMRDFKRKYNTSPFAYYRKLQMEYAAQYIQETGCSKKQMALILGFSNPANFTSCYNRWQYENRISKQKELLASKQDLSVIHQLPFAVALLNLDYKEMAVSHEWHQLFNGIPNSNSLWDILPGDPARWKTYFSQALEKHETMRVVTSALPSNSDSAQRFLWTIKCYVNSNAQIIGLWISAEKAGDEVIEHNQYFFEYVQV